MRAGAHTDYGSLTILLPEAGSRGLEILAPDGAWIEVRPRPGAFIVNLGDLMARWTNDRWTSTLHRVVIPADGAAARRQSFAFFHQPNWNAEITALAACLAPGETPKYAAGALGAVSDEQVQVDDDVRGWRIAPPILRAPFSDLERGEGRAAPPGSKRASRTDRGRRPATG